MSTRKLLILKCRVRSTADEVNLQESLPPQDGAREKGSHSSSSSTELNLQQQGSSAERGQKRSRNSNGSGKDRDNRDRKRSRPFLLPPLKEDDKTKYACPYRKHNAQKYCVHNWRSCALTPFETVARVK